MPLVRQCELLGLVRSSLYYRPAGEDEENLQVMRLIDRLYTARPFLGSRRMSWYLQRQGHEVNRKRVQRLMRLMGLEAIYPKRNLSRAGKEAKHYPYLLRGLEVNRPNQVWAADITYIRLLHGYLYLVAVVDWWSRYVLAWETSNTLDADFCVAALRRALEGGKPEIFNTDQGVQFSCGDFLGVLEGQQIRVSMDGRGRALDNVYVERLWRSLKYEEVYLREYEYVIEAVEGIGGWFRFYNYDRPHQGLGDRTPAEVYLSRVAKRRTLQVVSM
jgi:putative transposase